MNKLPYIFTVVDVILSVLFAILNRFWTGFVYFVFASLFVLAVFWGIWLIHLYFSDFKHELEDQFAFYRAQKINSGVVSAENFDANITAYKKDFNKHVLKDKITKWFFIIICFSIAVVFVVAMIIN